jgi:non-ribosomal peptide synthetase component F
VKSRKFCPVGKPLPGVQVPVMDDQLNASAVGVRGEVCIWVAYCQRKVFLNNK